MTYGCHNRAPLRTERIVQDGWTKAGLRRMKRIADPMSKDCRYAAHGYAKEGHRCDGCHWLPPVKTEAACPHPDGFVVELIGPQK